MMMVKKRWNKLAWLVCAALLWTLVLPGFSGTAQAAIPKLDNIRVALFIQTRETAPAVTLSIASPAQIGIRTPEGIRSWLSIGDGSPVRFSIDQFRIVMFESTDLSAAKAVAEELAAIMNNRERAFVLSTVRSGAVVYQVTAGNYQSLQEANAAKERLLANDRASSLLNGFPVQIAGPYHLSAGTFTTEQEAKAVQSIYQERGIDAALVYHENADQMLVYSVWIGEAASSEQLDEVKNTALAAVPEFPLSAADQSQPYLYLRMDHTDDRAIPHYYFNANNQKVWFSASVPGIKVHERYGRTYRGSMEITQYNDRLALINELPFEQYLYAVVSNEMGGGFPMEALKAQAVAARTYALQQGMKYGIAHISDTTYDQAYYGYGTEAAAAVRAVDATKSEVVVSRKDHSLITPFYSSNAGGFTSDTDEVWGTAVDYLHSVPSPDDVAEQGRHTWHRVITPSGLVGYVRQDLVRTAGTTAAGLTTVSVIEPSVNVRPSPDTSGTPITQVKQGDVLIVLETMKESNPYSWVSVTWKADQLLSRINQYARAPITGELRSLHVAERGISGRVISVVANGHEKVQVSYPDAYRTVMGGLRSTRFDIDQTNDLTILAAGNVTTNVKDMYPAAELYVLTGHSASTAQPVQGEYLYAMNGKQEIRTGTLDPRFRFIGRGYGHGLGMSQYGAKALAELGYDYQKILQYYYKDVQVIRG